MTFIQFSAPEEKQVEDFEAEVFDISEDITSLRKRSSIYPETIQDAKESEDPEVKNYYLIRIYQK